MFAYNYNNKKNAEDMHVNISFDSSVLNASG